MAKDDPSETLVRRAQEGDRGAFQALVERCSDRLSALIADRLGPAMRERVEPEDVRQEVFLRAFRSIRRFESRGEESFIRWLGAIAENVIREEVDRRRPQATTSSAFEAVANELSPSHHLRREERFERLRSALGRLSPEHREVILLARIERLPGAEIARRMERTPAAVAQLLSRALKKLREVFGETESIHLPPHRLDGEANDGEEDHVDR